MNNTVYIIDDDASIRDSLGLLLSLRGYRTSFFSSAESFLNAWRGDWHGCLLIDIRMPDMDGLTLQKTLQAQGCMIPVVIITGHGDVNSSREAFRSNAIDFLEKPLEEARLIEAIEQAFLKQNTQKEVRIQQERFTRKLADLTRRELEVMQMVVSGRHNREIAIELGISPRTVEVHKARMMAKLEAGSIPELVRMCIEHTKIQAY